LKHLNQRKPKEFSFSQKIDLLHGLSILSSRHPSVLNSKVFKDSLAALDSVVYEMVDNDLTFK
jgi:hypothetical protein